MKLGIFSNFGSGNKLSGSHEGGSECVLKHVSEILTSDYNYKVSIYAYNYHQQSICDGVNLIPCKRDGSILISQINENDAVLVYSDSTWNMGDIIRNIKNIDCKVSLALVGAYFLQSHPDIADILKKNINKFNLITHSSITPDYKWCIDNNLPVRVISNGIDLKEFDNDINFREKYKIKEKYIILNVSNFFFGKNQIILPLICNKLSKYIDDFIFVQISSTIDYKYDKIFLEKTKRLSSGKILFLRDIPREDTVAAFKCSDLFLQTSQKEVAPLVILESRAAGLPWISMDVGNVESIPGGIIINNPIYDEKGYKIVSDKIIDKFVSNIKYVLLGASAITGQSIRKELIRDGQKNIEAIDWKEIVSEYNEVFNL
jgi:glycosyltransferase involved in cell wall biosynthesis